MAYTNIVTKQPRGPGVIQSTWRVVPGGTTTVRIRALMDAADIQDPSLELPFRILGSFDGGTNFYLLAQSRWRGGMQDRSGTFVAPYVTIQTQPMPTHMRAQADPPRQFPLGVEAETA